jgi:hypothetical protein
MSILSKTCSARPQESDLFGYPVGGPFAHKPAQSQPVLCIVLLKYAQTFAARKPKRVLQDMQLLGLSLGK